MPLELETDSVWPQQRQQPNLPLLPLLPVPSSNSVCTALRIPVVHPSVLHRILFYSTLLARKYHAITSAYLPNQPNGQPRNLD